jgi:hypothetical protein
MGVARNASSVRSCACMQKSLAAYPSEPHSRRISTARTVPEIRRTASATERSERRGVCVTEESILSYYMFTKHVMCPVTGMEIAYAMFRRRSWEDMGISRGPGSDGRRCTLQDGAVCAARSPACLQQKSCLNVCNTVKIPAVHTSASISLHNVSSAALRIGAYSSRDAQLAFLNLHVHHPRAILPSIAVRKSLLVRCTQHHATELSPQVAVRRAQRLLTTTDSEWTVAW